MLFAGLTRGSLEAFPLALPEQSGFRLRKSKLLKLDGNSGIPMRQGLNVRIGQGLGNHGHHLVRALAAPVVFKLLGQVDLGLTGQVGHARLHGHAHGAVADGAGCGGLGAA